MISIVTLTAFSHITLNPSIGGFSGGYFHTTIRVPHGAPGLHTTKLEIDVPHGILVAKPEVPEDWTASIEDRTLPENEQYISHGNLKTNAPHKIVLRANSHSDGVHDDHLLNIDMQLKIGCVFQDAESNTVWDDEYTLWWPIVQTCENDNGETTLLKWDGTQKDKNKVSPAWSALPDGVLPSPYLHIEPGQRCTAEYEGSDRQGGLLWFGTYISPVFADDSGGAYRTLDYIILVLSIAGLGLGVMTVTFCVVALCFRLRDKRRFTQHFLGVEYTSSNYPNNSYTNNL